MLGGYFKNDIEEKLPDRKSPYGPPPLREFCACSSNNFVTGA